MTESYNSFKKSELIELIKRLDSEVKDIKKTEKEILELGKILGSQSRMNFEKLQSIEEKNSYLFEENINLRIKNTELSERLETLMVAHEQKSGKEEEKKSLSAYDIKRYNKLLGKNALKLENKLNSRLFGQEESNAKISRLLRAHFSGLKEDIPAVYFLHGPTGCGKTYTAEILSEFLFEGFGKDKPPLLKINGSDFMEKHEVAKLIGAPPGYIGRDDGSILTNHMTSYPVFSLMLIDEVEKAHQSFQNIFLPLFDKGFTPDSYFNNLDGRKYIILMTSNIGESFVRNKHSLGFNFGDIEEKEESMKFDLIEGFFRKSFSPEFRNRIGETIHLRPLSKKAIEQILDFEFQKIRKRSYNLYRSDLSLEPEARNKLLNEGFSSEYGARNLKRYLEKEIMANCELIDLLNQGKSCLIGCSADRFTFKTYQKPLKKNKTK